MIFNSEPSKIRFAFFGFFYDFIWILQYSANHIYYLRMKLRSGPLNFPLLHIYALGLQKQPWKDQGTRNWVPGAGRRWPLTDSGEEAVGVSGERVGEALWLTNGLICTGFVDRARRRRARGGAGQRRPLELRLWWKGVAPAHTGGTGGCKGLCGVVMRLVGGGKAGRQELASSIDGGRLAGLRMGSRRPL
jgi:hypothetical protein